MRSVVFRILRLERNSKIFDGKGGEEVDFLQDRVRFWAWALLWDSKISYSFFLMWIEGAAHS